tara:strand:+ start:12461 stop:13786 length:1326 start_codon:yes stop_codon:yes gene_type:complete
MEKTPYYNLEAEQALIGVCLLGGIEECMTAGVDGSWFFDLRHHQVYELLESMAERAEDIDLQKVTYELNSRNLLDKIGGVEALMEWENQAPTKHNAEYWLSELFVYKTRRQTKSKLENALQAISQSNTAEIDDVVSSLQTFVLDMKDHVSKTSDETLKETIPEIISEIEERFNNKTATPWGIGTGFSELDNYLGGLKDGSVYIIAGRPGQGKTAMALSIARNILISGSPVAMFSLEMTKKELGMRLMAAHADLDMKHVYKGTLSQKEFEKISVSAEVRMLPLFINDRTDLTANMLRSEARRYVNNHGVRVIIVDYLQLLQGSKDARKQGKYEVVSEISRGIKLMAQELNVPVIALAQLNREVEKSSKRRPQLSDLRDSGSIEQDADSCLFLYEPPEEDGTFSEIKRINLFIAKNRNGEPNKDVEFEFKPEYTKFIQLSPVR